MYKYARVCLDLDPATLDIKDELEASDGGYVWSGRGGISPSASFVGEEVRGDVTVVTVRFWADYSKTVESCVVEYHLVPTEIDRKLVKTVTVSDSGFDTVSTSI